jgi:hypothetical protein
MKNLIASTKNNVAKKVLKALLFIAPIAGFTACEKPPVDPVQHDTEYKFGVMNAQSVFESQNLKLSTDSAQVRNVYLVPDGDWKNGNIHNMIHQGLVPTFGISPKVKGKGNFEHLGVNESDSLLLVSMGYTVNQY